MRGGASWKIYPCVAEISRRVAKLTRNMSFSTCRVIQVLATWLFVRLMLQTLSAKLRLLEPEAFESHAPWFSLVEMLGSLSEERDFLPLEASWAEGDARRALRLMPEEHPAKRFEPPAKRFQHPANGSELPDNDSELPGSVSRLPTPIRSPSATTRSLTTSGSRFRLSLSGLWLTVFRVLLTISRRQRRRGHAFVLRNRDRTGQ